MTDDLIGRQAAIEAFYKYPNVNWTTLDVLNILSDLPSAEPEIRCVAQINFSKDDLEELVNTNVAEIKAALPKTGQWIPVTERLPEDEVNVLVTDDAGGLATIEIDCMFTREDTEEREWFTSQRVTAWMPLPEPWKGEDDG